MPPLVLTRHGVAQVCYAGGITMWINVHSCVTSNKIKPAHFKLCQSVVESHQPALEYVFSKLSPLTAKLFCSYLGPWHKIIFFTLSHLALNYLFHFSLLAPSYYLPSTFLMTTNHIILLCENGIGSMMCCISFWFKFSTRWWNSIEIAPIVLYSIQKFSTTFFSPK